MAVCNKAPELASNVAKAIQRGYFESRILCIFRICLRIEVALLPYIVGLVMYIVLYVCDVTIGVLQRNQPLHFSL